MIETGHFRSAISHTSILLPRSLSTLVWFRLYLDLEDVDEVYMKDGSGSCTMHCVHTTTKLQTNTNLTRTHSRQCVRALSKITGIRSKFSNIFPTRFILDRDRINCAVIRNQRHFIQIRISFIDISLYKYRNSKEI